MIRKGINAAVINGLAIVAKLSQTGHSIPLARYGAATHDPLPSNGKNRFPPQHEGMS
jgi:hypothetical protein